MRMKFRLYAFIGLAFLILNQVLLLRGNEFIQTQQPIDFAHWLLFFGVLLCISLNYIFSKGLFNSVASGLTTMGVVALVGQAVIDLIWWSYGTDYEGVNRLTNQLMSHPSIRIPFMTIGPALFYLGIAIHSGKFFKKYTAWALVAICGVIITGVGSFALDSRLAIVIGHLVMATGVLMLVFKEDLD